MAKRRPLSRKQNKKVWSSGKHTHRKNLTPPRQLGGHSV